MSGGDRRRAVTAKAKAEDVPFIHLLRGLAPLPVLWVHLYVQNFWLHDRLDEVITLLRIAPGHLGVVIFFFVSGFVISHVAMVETRREFIIKRVFRIWPTLVLAILLTWLAKTVAASLFGANPFVGFSTATTAKDYLESLFFLDWVSAGGRPSKEKPHALVIDWTLFIEVMFYAIVAALIRLLRLKPATSTLTMIGAVTLASLAYTLDGRFLHVNYTSTCILLIIVGRVFYLHWSGIVPAGWMLVLLALSLGLYLVLVSQLPLNTLLVPPYELLVTYLVSAAIFFAVMKLNVRRVAQPVRFLADISYSVYMLHVPIGISVVSAGRGLGVPPELSFAAACVAVGAASWAITRYVERPAQRLARSLISAMSATRAAECGGSSPHALKHPPL